MLPSGVKIDTPGLRNGRCAALIQISPRHELVGRKMQMYLYRWAHSVDLWVRGCVLCSRQFALVNLAGQLTTGQAVTGLQRAQVRSLRPHSGLVWPSGYQEIGHSCAMDPRSPELPSG